MSSTNDSTTKRRKIDFNCLKNTRIDFFEKLIIPTELIKRIPISCSNNRLVLQTRHAIEQIISKKDHRMLFVVGPCSIHNVEEAKEYAHELKKIADIVSDRILIVMRVYFEKPRTTIGWKGLINDPDLNNSFDVNKGLWTARELLNDINELGLPCGYEVLDTITPQYISDMISWGAIGARTSESQIHRQLVSGLSMPIGFKNGTSGDIKVAADAIVSASFPHCFMGITDAGEPAICKTKGHPFCHIILRGGNMGPNYEASHIQATRQKLIKISGKASIMVDCSHGNSKKIHCNQPIVLENIIQQRVSGNTDIIGIMLESNINEGKQKLKENGTTLKRGVSITDACIDINTTREVILSAYRALGTCASIDKKTTVV